MGVSFIWLAALLVKVHGVLVLGLCMIAGQVICAELIELLGPSAHVGIVGVVAGVLTVIGVLVALLLRPSARHTEHV
jgi:transporter family-2 protein